MKATVIKVASMTLAFAAQAGAAFAKSAKRSKGAKGNPTHHATMAPYPGYDGLLEMSGEVTVEYVGNEDALQYMLFSFDLRGVAPDCSKCGIHIHTGTGCDDPNQPGGHYWKDSLVPDHWTSTGGAVYNSNGIGRAKGSFYVTNGFGPAENLGHAVVVHTQDGTRVGCGLLMV